MVDMMLGGGFGKHFYAFASSYPTLDHPSEQKSLAGDPEAAKTKTRRGWGTHDIPLSMKML
jgi:hypothetical protein